MNKMNVSAFPMDTWNLIGKYLTRNEKYNIAKALCSIMTQFPLNKWVFISRMCNETKKTIPLFVDEALYSNATELPSNVFADWSQFLLQHRKCKPIATIC